MEFFLLVDWSRIKHFWNWHKYQFHVISYSSEGYNRQFMFPSRAAKSCLKAPQNTLSKHISLFSLLLSSPQALFLFPQALFSLSIRGRRDIVRDEYCKRHLRPFRDTTFGLGSLLHRSYWHPLRSLFARIPDRDRGSVEAPPRCVFDEILEPMPHLPAAWRPRPGHRGLLGLNRRSMPPHCRRPWRICRICGSPCGGVCFLSGPLVSKWIIWWLVWSGRSELLFLSWRVYKMRFLLLRSAHDGVGWRGRLFEILQGLRVPGFWIVEEWSCHWLIKEPLCCVEWWIPTLLSIALCLSSRQGGHGENAPSRWLRGSIFLAIILKENKYHLLQVWIVCIGKWENGEDCIWFLEAVCHTFEGCRSTGRTGRQVNKAWGW